MSKENDTRTTSAVNSSFSYPDYCYVETAIGSVRNRNNILKIDNLPDFQPAQTVFTSMYRFTDELKNYVAKNGSVSKMPPTVAWSDYLWLDIDNSDDLSLAHETSNKIITRLLQVDRSAETQLAIYFSGMKGFHIGIPSVFFGLAPSPDLPGIHKKLALTLANGLKIDSGIYQQSRLFRLPNTLHQRSQLYKVRLTLEQMVKLTVEQIRHFATQPRGASKLDLISKDGAIHQLDEFVQMVTPSKTSADVFFTRVKLLMNDKMNPSAKTAATLSNLKNGNRHNTFTSLIGRLHRAGISSEDIFELLRGYARKVGFEGELASLITDITTRYPSNSSTIDDIYKTTNVDNFDAVTLKEFLDTTDRNINWIVDGIIPKESASIIAGYPGSGKTFILADLALAVSSGTKFLNKFETEQGRVLVIDEENSPQLMAHRFSGLINGKSLEKPPPTLRIALGHGFRFDSSEYVKKLENILDDFRPSLVIVDSLIRVHNGEENSSSEMSKIFGRVKSLMQKYEISFVFSDHFRKPGTNISSAGASLRGSTDKWAFVDTLWSVKKESDRIDVEQVKSRFREEHLSLALRLTDQSENSISLEYIGDARQLKQTALLQDSKAFLLRTIGNEWVPRRALLELGKAEGLKSGLMDKAFKELTDFNIIIREEQKTEGRGPKRHAYKLNPDHITDIDR